MGRGIRYFIGLVAAAGYLAAGESVVLTTGYEIRADWHEVQGDRVRLHSGAGVTELPATSVARIDLDAPEALPLVARKLVVTDVTASADLAAEAARKTALPEAFIRSVMKTESNFVPTAISPKGAIGLMQLMPETAAELGVDPRDSQQNAEGGARYLRDLLVKYADDPNQVLLALAAYNAGPGAVQRYSGVPPFSETREYILRVLKEWKAAETATSPGR